MIIQDKLISTWKPALQIVNPPPLLKQTAQQKEGRHTLRKCSHTPSSRKSYRKQPPHDWDKGKEFCPPIMCLSEYGDYDDNNAYLTCTVLTHGWKLVNTDCPSYRLFYQNNLTGWNVSSGNSMSACSGVVLDVNAVGHVGELGLEMLEHELQYLYILVCLANI